MSRNPAVMTELAGLEERIAALLGRLEQVAGSATQHWASAPGMNSSARESAPVSEAPLPDALPAAGAESRVAEELAVLLKQSLREEQPDDTEETPPWVAGLQNQLTQVEQQMESLRASISGPARFS